MSVRTPSYRFHKPSGQAVVTLNGRDYYLGKHGTPQSRTEYDRLLAEWLVNGRHVTARARDNPPSGASVSPDELTVSEMILAYLRYAEGYYRKGGKPTGEVPHIKYAMGHLRRLYGHTSAKNFGPLALKTVRQQIIDSGLCRNEVNRRTRIIVRAFKWATENELVPLSIHHGLRAVSGLRKGRSEARESEPVKPVPDELVDAIAPYVSRQVGAMIQLQRLSGMRPGEVCMLRTCDLDTSGRVWVYTPETHKTEHHGRDRKIYFGPAAQAVLRQWVRADPNDYLFQPREVVEESLAERRRNRKSPMTPSQQARTRKHSPKKAPGACYTADSYREAIVKACKLAFPHPELTKIPQKDLTPDQQRELKAWHHARRWHPNQLRHNAATKLRRQFGLDVAQVILGHSSSAVTEVYAEVDEAKAIGVMEQIG
ncbi:Phage integrase family protein [Singulisphaera sp. GP187]|uniref:tyrosine-type recombinase/integrase n=1 Tax=Singulisphaera sp. GP187 TaxID=1882752 RepID=UPI000925ED2C|nr:tyrosine-type recombinase/integrase [Singulisphaera sp. GP187]SIN68950.1 Phage integrase family protein [Singulisphaera sp. GP187]